MKKLNEYIKKENIIGYLSYKLDSEKLLKYINEDEFEEEKQYNENIEDKEDYISQEIQKYNYLKALDNQDIELLLDLIYGCEFDIEINKDGTLSLLDMQGAYLGGKESYENLKDISSVVDRLSGSYFYDYYGI